VAFSARVPADLGSNRLAQAVQRARAAGPLVDLTESNPTRAGFDYTIYERRAPWSTRHVGRR
jgi:hypothetical protein